MAEFMPLQLCTVFLCFHRDQSGSQLTDLLPDDPGQVPLFSSVK